MTGTGRIAFIRPHSSATAVSTGSTRSPKPAVTSPSHASSASALPGSRRRASSTPLRTSPSTSALSHRSSSATPDHQSRHGRVAAVALAHFRDDVGVDQEAHRETSRPKSRGRSEIDPFERRRDEQRLEPTAAGGDNPFPQDGARLALARGITECGGDVPDEGGVLLPDLNLDAHEALPLTAFCATG